MSRKNFRQSAGNIFVKNHSKIIPNKDDELSKTVRLRKLKTLLSLNDKKILEIKGRRKMNSFHLIGENDKYRLIEKNIQNKILNISMLIIDHCKFNLDLDEETKNKQKKNKRNTNPLKHFGNSNSNLNSCFFRSSFNMGNSPNHTRLSRPSKMVSSFAIYKEIINETNRKIKRIPALYDSFGEDETDKEMNQKNYGLNPKSIFIDIYDMFILISVGFCLFYIPYRLAKTKLFINGDEHCILFLIYFSEIIFIIDVIIGFFRWFYNNEFKLISEKKGIISNYLYGYFFFDVLMAIPFYSILKYENRNNEDNNILYNENYFFIKIIICLKAFKIIKLNNIKNNRIIYFFNNKFAKNFYLERIYQISNFILLILAVFNLFVCLHIYMAQLSYPNWIISFNLQDTSFIEIYISSLYFIMATLTSVGYGDIVCKSYQETCFQILLLSIGLVAYSWIISTVGDYVKNKSRANLNYNRDMTKLEELRIQYPNMPYKLYNKIQQHIQRILTQSKKYEYHLLVNTLPYYLQNSVLFQIHKNEINKFTFFKNCDNSDFILKVLTRFIPVFSKKNIVIVGEGEYLQNIFFIKEGRLSLEAIIDLNNIEMSLEKYLKYRFEEIELIDDLSEDSFSKSRIANDSIGKNSKARKYFEIINKQFENLEENSSIYESDIEQELAKCDFHLENHDFYGRHIQYIHILDLLKNEHYGELLMFLNIPNPLSLRVKSKRVELYMLRRKDAFNIKRDYQNIWKRINKKSIHNLKSLKSLTLDIINRYCEMNGLLVKGDELINLKTKKTFNLGRGSTLNKNPTYSRTIGKTKFGQLKNETTFLNIKTKESSKNVFKIRSSHNKESSKSNLFDIKKRERKNSFDSSSKRKGNGILKNKGSSSSIDSKEIKMYKDLNYTNINNKSIKNNNLQKIKNVALNQNKSSKNLKTAKFRCKSPSLSAKCLPTKSFQKNNIPKISKKDNVFMKTKISTINESESDDTKAHNFQYLKKDSTIHFQIMSSYNNINQISKGQYIKDNKLQDLIQNIAKYFFDLEKIGKNIYYKKFNYFKYLFNKLINNEYDSDFTKISNNKVIVEKSSLNSKNNKKIKQEFRKSIKNKNIPIKKTKTKYNNIPSKHLAYPLYNEKYILESGDIKSMSSMNQLKSIINDKNDKKKSDKDINNNISNEKLKNNKQRCKHSKTFQKLKKEDDNNLHINKKTNKEKSPDNLYKNSIIKNENNIREVNLNYVNNFCYIY